MDIRRGPLQPGYISVPGPAIAVASAAELAVLRRHPWLVDVPAGWVDPSEWIVLHDVWLNPLDWGAQVAWMPLEWYDGSAPVTESGVLRAGTRLLFRERGKLINPVWGGLEPVILLVDPRRPGQTAGAAAAHYAVLTYAPDGSRESQTGIGPRAAGVCIAPVAHAAADACEATLTTLRREADAALARWSRRHGVDLAQATRQLPANQAAAKQRTRQEADDFARKWRDPTWNPRDEFPFG